MGEVIELDDPFTYVVDDGDGKFVAVQWTKHPNYLTIGLDGKVDSLIKTNCIIPPHELRQLFIMWLALNNPDCLNFEAVETENKIREEAD